MKWSQYNYYWQIEDNHTYIYNSLEKKIAYINAEPKCDLNSIAEEIDTLYKEGFIYEGDETIKAMRLYEKDKYAGESISFWVYVTNACNFKCTYCFEGHTCQVNTKKGIMDKETAYTTAKWILAKTKELNFANISITYMGGEPLLNTDAIKIISEVIKADTTINANFSIITNGYRLNEENILALDECGIGSYQITLDGPEKIHDSRRYLMNGEGTFRVILENIERMVNRENNIEITIRINCDSYNIDSIKALLKWLHLKGLSKIISIDMGEVIGGIACDKEELRNKIIENIKYAKKLGFPLSLACLNRCWKNSERWFLIATDGDIYKCPLEMDNKTKRVESILEQKIYPSYYEKMVTEINVNCIKCELFGICGGGCHNFQEAQKSKCKKAYLQKIIQILYSK